MRPSGNSDENQEGELRRTANLTNTDASEPTCTSIEEQTTMLDVKVPYPPSAPERPDDLVDVDDDDVALTFPQRLMEVLEDEANESIISWLPHGLGFAIYKKKAFEQVILPKYFHKHSKYSSFTRKLNRWGFTRASRGSDAGAYFHPNFRRNGHKLLMQMSCNSSPSTGKTGNSKPAVKGPVYSRLSIDQSSLIAPAASAHTASLMLAPTAAAGAVLLPTNASSLHTVSPAIDMSNFFAGASLSSTQENQFLEQRALARHLQLQQQFRQLQEQQQQQQQSDLNVQQLLAQQQQQAKLQQQRLVAQQRLSLQQAMFSNQVRQSRPPLPLEDFQTLFDSMAARGRVDPNQATLGSIHAGLANTVDLMNIMGSSQPLAAASIPSEASSARILLAPPAISKTQRNAARPLVAQRADSQQRAGGAAAQTIAAVGAPPRQRDEQWSPSTTATPVPNFIGSNNDPAAAVGTDQKNGRDDDQQQTSQCWGSTKDH